MDITSPTLSIASLKQTIPSADLVELKRISAIIRKQSPLYMSKDMNDVLLLISTRLLYICAKAGD